MDPKWSPYRGIVLHIFALVFPSVIMTWMFHAVIERWQPQFSAELNWASAKALGCGIGVIFHLSLFLFNQFWEPFGAVKNRVRDFFENLSISPKMAFSSYIQDIKDHGIVFWIYFAIISANFGIALDAFLDFRDLYIK